MKKWKIVKAVVWTVASILVLVFHKALAEPLVYLVGWLMIVYGIEKAITHIAKKEKWTHEHNFFWGLMEISLGVLMIAALPNVENSYMITCIIWAVWSIFREAVEIQEAVKELIHKEPAILSIIESLVSIVFSFLLILSPEIESATHHIILLSIELISSGLIFPLEKYLYGKYLKPKFEKKSE